LMSGKSDCKGEKVCRVWKRFSRFDPDFPQELDHLQALGRLDAINTVATMPEKPKNKLFSRKHLFSQAKAAISCSDPSPFTCFEPRDLSRIDLTAHLGRSPLRKRPHSRPHPQIVDPSFHEESLA
jgi:hypothetical protein